MNIDDSVNMDDLVIEGEDLSGLELAPPTWHRFVQAQIELLRAHVHGLEKQIDESVKAYEKEKVVTDVSTPI